MYIIMINLRESKSLINQHKNEYSTLIKIFIIMIDEKHQKFITLATTTTIKLA